MVEPANETTSFVKALKKKIARRLMKDAGLLSSDEEDMPLVKMIKAEWCKTTPMMNTMNMLMGSRKPKILW